AVNHDATLTGNGNSVPLSLADNAVSSVKLADGAVTTAKIGDNAVTSVKIADGAISDAKIAGVSGSKVTGNISGNAANVSGVVAIANGGTGATTAAAARNALLPSQAGNAGKVLQTDGSNVSWVTAPSGGSGGISAVSHDATLTGDGNSTPLGLSDNAVTAAKIAAGTITPDKLSSLGGNGTNGQVLTSNGAGGCAWSAPAAGGGTGDMSKSTYDPANISQQVVGTTAVQTLTNKTLHSPALTGVPTAPTAALGTNTTQVATTAFVAAATAAGTPDATASVKGKIQLAGDLAGTAAAPVIANQAVTPAKLKNITGNGTSGQVLTSDGAGGFSWAAAGGSMPNIASNTILGNNTTGTAAPAGLTPAQVKTLLGLTKTDVGLSNVDNTADAGKS